MKIRVSNAAMIGIALLFAAGGSAAANPMPELFAPGPVSGPSNDGAPTFTPDGRTIFFDRTASNWVYIVTSHFDGKHWSNAVLAPFAGPSSDQQPFMSPDGKFIVYVSSRPQPGSSTKRVSHIFRADRTASGWATPVELPEAVNFSRIIFRPSVAANGDIYFMSTDAPHGSDTKWRLYRSAFVNGAYQKAEPLSFSDGAASDVDPCIAPDSSWLIFSSKGRAAFDADHEHLFIAFRNADGWSAPVAMRYDGDTWGADDGEADVSPDGKRVYFTSARSAPPNLNRTRADMAKEYAASEIWDNGNNNVWSLPLAPYLAR